MKKYLIVGGVLVALYYAYKYVWQGPIASGLTAQLNNGYSTTGLGGSQTADVCYDGSAPPCD